MVDSGTGWRGASGSVEIDLPCGAVMRVPGEAGLLERVLGVLLEAEAPNGVASQGSSGASC